MNTSMADVDSIDAPPRVAPPSVPETRPVAKVQGEQSADQRQQRRCDLEDIFQPSSTADGHAADGKSGPHRGGDRSSTSSSSSCRVRTPLMSVAASRHGASGRDGQLTSSPANPGPSLARQYGENAALTRAIAADVAAASAEITSHRQKSRVAKFLLDMEGDPSVSTDALLRRMQTKEKEFDEKIHQIHHTFQNAGEQLVVRDNIISHLKEELAGLRAEVARIPKEYQEREEKLLLRVEAMMTELSEEQKRAHHSRRTAEEESRCAYEAKLSELQRTFRSMEKQVAKSQSRLEDMEKDRCQQQAKLLELELSGRRRISSETVKAKELLTENEALRDEVEAVRLSMARLLRLMSEVPVLSDYLQWNELSSEFVFLGYPTRYFDTSHRGRGTSSLSPSRRTGSHGASPARRRAAAVAAGDDMSFDRPGPSSHSSGYYQDTNVSGISAGDTGVEDGVYAGVAASLSKNVWLNGRWAQEMISIISAENNFTRLKRIKLLELEEAAQLSERLPSARDVLECRKPEHHYWIPYAVFMEAQKFKNKYYPKLPAMSHFSPFLIQLNKIWRAKLQDRLRIMQQQNYNQPQQPSQARRSATAESRFASRARTREGNLDDQGSSAVSRLTSRGCVAPLPRPGELFSEWARQEARMDEIHAEHHRLRREVRLHVSSQKGLQLFRLYDELVRGAHQTLGEVLRLAEDLYDSAMAQRVSESEDRKRAASSALHEIKQQGQASAEMADLAEARDRLLCVVDHTCQQVCDVGDSLSTRMMSYYSDLHQLIHMLHHHIRQARERSRHKTREQASSDGTRSGSSTSSSTAPWSGRISSTVLSTEELQQRLRELLHGHDALLKLAASVLDFGEEVRREVTHATAALRVVAEQGMREAAQCQGA
ncbi:hypothetical protein CGC21_25685 [Leishmania donovani]|uniref:Uncharacterized protein n=1 Tax=Leishmania donovani TaxID=5661 RepID=A0A504WVV5_LEIDO|nr:hypothetical protein CGC21_25685 [Leishmania donovani]